MLSSTASAMVDPGATESKTSPLEGLPPELQGLVFVNLNSYDLNRLCLTCKTIRAVVLPKLYKTVAIKVPQKWSRLPSFESLLASNGDGLKYTTELFIDTQQDPLRDSQQESQDPRLPEEVLSESKLQFFLPQISTSNALNALVRLLISKLPQHQLELFRWEHCCELDASTLNILFDRQRDSLDALFCNRCSPACDISGTVMRNLRSLTVQSMQYASGGSRWAAAMITRNAETLDHLDIGFSTRIARDFALKMRPRQHVMTTSFRAAMKNRLSQLGLRDTPVRLSLESLLLCGLDIESVVRGEMAVDIDFNTITRLRFESCSGLSHAFSLLMGPPGSSKLALGALEDLFIRLEDPDVNFPASLESFLTSIRGLIHLKVLIDKAPDVQNLEPILKVHGKTLSTLVWDERRGPRTHLDASTSLLPTTSSLGNLSLISRDCPCLTTLGMSLSWEAITLNHGLVRKFFKRMPCLEALNIRNLPQIKGVPIMPMDYYVKGLAAMFVDIVAQRRESTFLEAIAIGAPLYRDIYIGTHHVVHTPVSDLLRFRLYGIDYDYPSPSGPSPVLSQVVKGAADSSEDSSYLNNFLYDYWLG